MPGFALLSLRVALIAGLFVAAGTSEPLAQQRVGVNSAVNPDATGAPPGAAPRRLVIGQEIVFNERITTGASGQTQLLFLDESSMSVGANSDLTIDQFVYDPRSGTGKLAMSATRGLLRYVGGKLSKQDNAVTLRTSTATLAVRGGAFILNIKHGGQTDVIFVFGAGLTVAGVNGIVQTLRRPGFQITISAAGAASPPTAVSPATLAQLIAELDGRTGGTGGASVIPTDATVVDSGVSQTVSDDLAESLLQAAQNQGSPTTLSPTTISASITSTVQSTAVQPGIPTQIPTQIPTPIPTPPPPPPPPPVTISYAGIYKTTPGSGSSRGFVSNSPVFNISYAGGQIGADGFYTAQLNGSTIRFPVAANGGSLSFGTAGTASPFGPISGTSFITADRTFLYSNNTEVDFTDERSFVSGGTPVNSSFYQPTGSTRVFAFNVQPDAALQSNIPFVRGQAGGNLANASVSPLYVVAPATTAIGDATTTSAARGLQASLAINGQGANQQSVIAVTTGVIGALQSNGQPILAGKLRGSSLQSATGTPVQLDSHVISTVDGNGNSFYGGSAISGFVLDQNRASGPAGSGILTITPDTASEVALSGATTNYGFAQPVLPVAVPSGIGTSRTTQALAGNFGGLMYTTAQTNPYLVTGGTLISTDAPNNRIQATLNGSAQSPSSGVNTLTMQYGSLTGIDASSAFVDNNTFGARESPVNPQQINGTNLVVNGGQDNAGNLYLLSSGTAPPPTSLLPSGAAYCQCQYLQWGYWGGDLRTGNSIDSSISRIDRGHINTWVAGVATPLNDLNTLMSQGTSATYTGHALGSVFNNGASYVTAGGFLGTYNFGTQSGTMAINNFDGRSFTATGAAPLTGANYSFAVTSPGATGALNGTFYGPAAAETGGSFAVKTTVGPTYLASGIFVGKK